MMQTRRSFLKTLAGGAAALLAGAVALKAGKSEVEPTKVSQPPISAGFTTHYFLKREDGEWYEAGKRGYLVDRTNPLLVHTQVYSDHGNFTIHEN